MNNLETLTDIFAAYINQQSIHDGIAQMVFVSSDSLEQHTLFLDAINYGIHQLESGNRAILDVINMSGYRYTNTIDAMSLLIELQHVYEAAYAANE